MQPVRELMVGPLVTRVRLGHGRKRGVNVLCGPCRPYLRDLKEGMKDQTPLWATPSARIPNSPSRGRRNDVGYIREMPSKRAGCPALIGCQYLVGPAGGKNQEPESPRNHLGGDRRCAANSSAFYDKRGETCTNKEASKPRRYSCQRSITTQRRSEMIKGWYEEARYSNRGT